MGDENGVAGVGNRKKVFGGSGSSIQGTPERDAMYTSLTFLFNHDVYGRLEIFL